MHDQTKLLAAQVSVFKIFDNFRRVA